LLASHFKVLKRDGYHGGAPLYIKEAFRGKTGVVLSAIFTFFCIGGALTIGAAIQAEAASEICLEAFDIAPRFCGITLAALSAFCVFGGGKRIGKVASAIVPFMSIAYILIAVYVILAESEKLPMIFKAIITDAFGTNAIGGGISGYITSAALRYGISRGLISNEAGCGTAPFAHARANETQPAKQAVFGIIEVFIDTVLLCTLTAVVIIAAYNGNVPNSSAGMLIVSHAFSKYFGSFAPAILCISIILFAFCSIICWGFYGTECLSLSHCGKNIRVLFCVSFTSFVYIGSVAPSAGIWLFSDIFCCLMLCLNTVCVLKLSDIAKNITNEYCYYHSSIKRDSTSNARSDCSVRKANASPHSDAETPKGKTEAFPSSFKARHNMPPPDRPTPNTRITVQSHTGSAYAPSKRTFDKKEGASSFDTATHSPFP